MNNRFNVLLLSLITACSYAADQLPVARNNHVITPLPFFFVPQEAEQGVDCRFLNPFTGVVLEHMPRIPVNLAPLIRASIDGYNRLTHFSVTAARTRLEVAPVLLQARLEALTRECVVAAYTIITSFSTSWVWCMANHLNGNVSTEDFDHLSLTLMQMLINIRQSYNLLVNPQDADAAQSFRSLRDITDAIIVIIEKSKRN